MPTTALVFLTGSVAICGLPPLNGFISEFMIYVASFRAVAQTPGLPVTALGASLIVICALALIGGLAVACFTKAFGVIFLGEPRSAHAADVHEAGPAMRIPMVVLAVICLVVGLSGPVMLALLGPAVGILIGGKAYAAANVDWAGNALQMITVVVVGMLILAVILAWVRALLLSGRSVGKSVTWDCGYARPTPRMQYTASSFAEPIIRLFRGFLRTRRRFLPPSGLFPTSSSFATETPDVYRERMYRPMFSTVESLLARFRWIQHGRVNVYILYVVLALLALLIWKLG
jgi:hydrogenase-4 component B